MEMLKEYADSLLYLKQKQTQLTSEIAKLKSVPNRDLPVSEKLLKLQYEFECLETLMGIVKHSYLTLTEPLDEYTIWDDDEENDFDKESI